MYICALYTQDPEIRSLIIFGNPNHIFVIYVLLCYYCDCDFTAFRNWCVGVVQRALSDIDCPIVTLVKLQVFRVSSG